MFLQSSTMGAKPACAVRRALRRNCRGMVTILVLFLIFLVVILTAVVVNWSYMVLVNRDMQYKCDTMALAAAPELLDVRVLQDAAVTQAGGPRELRAKAAVLADELRRRNNA